MDGMSQILVSSGALVFLIRTRLNSLGERLREDFEAFLIVKLVELKNGLPQVRMLKTTKDTCIVSRKGMEPAGDGEGT